MAEKKEEEKRIDKNRKEKAKKDEESWHVYLLECQDGSYYTGITNDLDKRMEKHREGNGSKYVKAKGYEQLLESRECKNKSQASKFEYRIKQLLKEQKLEWFK